jgi:heme a synthase
MLWTGLGLLGHRVAAARGTALRTAQTVGGVLVAMLFAMVLSGALVAGTHAGALYNTFPLMGEHFVPPEILALAPPWRNVFENQSTIQFDHRVIAWLLFFSIPLFCRIVIKRAPLARPAALVLLAMLLLQLSLGIATLLNGVPILLAAAHQAGAMILFALLIGVNHVLRLAPG